VISDLFESVPNFSEGRDSPLIDAIARAASRAHVLDVDPDPDHHRVVVSMAGTRERLLEGLMAAVAVAVDRIDLAAHLGVHPRVGAADVIPIVPLGEAGIDRARDAARELGARIWNELRVPVYFYGYGEDWTLADIRAGRAQPDLGGPDLHPTAGAVCVGARRLLVAFNVILPGASVGEARAVARSLRESAGGLRGVMALAFELPGRALQLSMNLFRLDETTPDDVLRELDRRGVRFESPQVVGLCPAVAATAAASGRILEGRIGDAVAAEGARRCRQRGGEEHAALAGRLENEATGLRQLGAGQVELLAGAERCVALARVLAAAGVLDPELDGLGRLAALGVRAALTRETERAYAARVAALDRTLAG
jgi:glutamate formiminotransferase